MEIRWIFNAASSFNKLWNKNYYENETRFNGVYSRDNFPKKIKDGANIINLDEYEDVGIHWIDLYVANIEFIYCDIFGVELVPKEIERFIRYKNIKTNIFRVQSYNSIILRYFCVWFIDFRVAGKTVIYFTSLFSAYVFEKNDSIILSYFKTIKIIVLIWEIKEKLD